MISRITKKLYKKEEQVEISFQIIMEPDVVKWIQGEDDILHTLFSKKKINKKKLKELEDEWGKKFLKKYRSDLSPKKQWTNLFGEYLCRDVFLMMGKKIWKPCSIDGICPDWETEEEIIEVKTGTYYTDGTAHEKILGVPIKYSSVPNLYKKPLKIICIGGAEKRCREDYKIIGPHIPHDKKEILDFYKEKKIEFIPFSDLLKSVQKNK